MVYFGGCYKGICVCAWGRSGFQIYVAAGKNKKEEEKIYTVITASCVVDVYERPWSKKNIHS